MKIDLSQIKEFLGCDDVFLTSLMRKFTEESKREITVLRSASDSRHWPLVKVTAHKMLSSTRIFNFDQLSEILEDIVIAAEKGGNTDHIPAKVNTAEKEWQHAIDAIMPLLEKPQA
jgi:hypothetical protein